MVSQSGESINHISLELDDGSGVEVEPDCQHYFLALIKWSTNDGVHKLVDDNIHGSCWPQEKQRLTHFGELLMLIRKLLARERMPQLGNFPWSKKGCLILSNRLNMLKTHMYIILIQTSSCVERFMESRFNLASSRSLHVFFRNFI